MKRKGDPSNFKGEGDGQRAKGNHNASLKQRKI
jgi:hypothetical protein